MITVAKGRCTSDPKLVARDAGNSPRMATNDVIRPGRRRSIRPMMMASSTDAPSRRCLLIPLNIKTPSMMAMPKSVAKPTPVETLRFIWRRYKATAPLANANGIGNSRMNAARNDP